MIVVDTSALVAMKQLEPDAAQLHSRISRASQVFVPATVLVEFALLRKLGPNRTDWLDDFVEDMGVEIAAVDAAVATLAVMAASRYGRGSSHPARLNFGDCLSYAVAKHLDAPLLYKGNDFAHTDIESASPA